MISVGFRIACSGILPAKIVMVHCKLSVCNLCVCIEMSGRKNIEKVTES